MYIESSCGKLDLSCRNLSLCLRRLTEASGFCDKDMSVDCSNFEESFEKGFTSWREHSVFIAAVSGGADSTAMLLALSVLARKRNYRVSCLHIRHNIRGAQESEQDLQFVRNLCGRLHIPLRIVTIKPGKITQRSAEKGLGIEAAAREYRHAAYRHELKRLGAEKIVTAHHKDDVLENTFMRILRGAGPRGLASMPASTNLFLRPMLTISREEILVYLNKMNQPFQTDLSNHDNHYFRNRVRNVLIPVLREHFPHWEKGVESLGNTQSYLAEYAEDEAKRLNKWQICENGLETDEKKIQRLHLIIQEEAVFQGIEKLLKCFGNNTEPLRADFDRQYRVPRREALRQFLKSGKPSMDLGKIRLERNSETFKVLRWDDPLTVRGGVFCAEKAGLHQFMRYGIQIDENPRFEPNFYAELPLVFRTPLMGEKISFKNYQKMKTKNAKDSIIVEDKMGRIAFLWLNQNTLNILPWKNQNAIGRFAVSVRLHDHRQH